jgi:hypothetical protein
LVGFAVIAAYGAFLVKVWSAFDAVMASFPVNPNNTSDGAGLAVDHGITFGCGGITFGFGCGGITFGFGVFVCGKEKRE